MTLPSSCLNQKFFTAVWSRPSRMSWCNSSKANSPSPVQIASTSARIASSGWMIAWMPPQITNVHGSSCLTRVMSLRVRSAYPVIDEKPTTSASIRWRAARSMSSSSSEPALPSVPRRPLRILRYLFVET